MFCPPPAAAHHPVDPAVARPPAAADDRATLAAAFAQVARALGDSPRRAHGAGARLAALWQRRLISGEGQPLGQLLGRGASTACQQPVLLRGLSIHLVCPHHWTVAMGEAEVAYLPGGRLFGLGRLTRLVQVACAQRILQEEAGQQIAQALRARGAAAVWVRLRAQHPCLALHQAGSGGHQLVSEAQAGHPAGVRALAAAARGAGRGASRR